MKKFLLIPALALLASCGSLQVDVDVLNPRVIEAEVERIQNREALDLALSQSRDGLHQYFVDFHKVHRQYYEDLKTQYLADAEHLVKPDENTTDDEMALAKIVLTEIANELLTEIFDRLVFPQYDVTEQQVWDLYLEARILAKERANASADEIAGITEQLTQVAMSTRAIKIGFAAWVERDIGRQALASIQELQVSPVSETQKETSVAAITETTNKAGNEVEIIKKTSLIGQGSLFQDPHAFAVASADDDMWADHYNQVFGKGHFGNLNVAIKMNSPADFTLKGLTFDPSQVASIAAKVSTQALLVATQIAGVPVNVSGSQQSNPASGNGAALAASSDALATVQAQTAQAEAKQADYLDALITIGLAITREDNENGLQADPAPMREKSAEAILSTFDAHKARLNLSISPEIKQ